MRLALPQKMSRKLYPKMIVTIEWMEEWFEKFNHDYFDGGLPLPQLELTRAKTRLGQLGYKISRRLGKTRFYDFKLAMTTYYDMTDWQAKNVLLHEMIHYAIGYTGLKDTSAHGVVFRGMMDNLNRKYGWEIRVSTSTQGWKLSDRVRARKEAQGPQTYLVLALEMDDGAYFLARVNPSFMRHVEALIGRARGVVSHRWYTTQEDYFEHYPQVRSLRGKRISKSDFHGLAKVLDPLDIHK